ncbi:DoxX family protein [Paenibacillus artemisiicola]|uniref:DoxX family protein n=1 Tax=Paenibacillus artemisiicola TaxID=1172618 RepID=UPI0030B8A71B
MPIDTAVIIVQALLGIFFIFTGTTIGSGKMADQFKRLGLPSFFNLLTGSIELAGAAGMIVGIWIPVAALLAGLLLGSTMLVAAFMLVALARDSFVKALPALILCILSYAVAAVVYML